MSSGDGRRRRVLSAEERVLWTTVTKSIAPLRESSESGDDEGPVSGTVRPKSSATRPPPIPPPSADRKHLPLAPLAPLAPLGRRMKQRVARGKEGIDGRLDLHGLTQVEAHATLLRFLRTASSRGAQLVLVITGKGARAGDGERGVLKRQVPQWLSLPEFRALIVGFEDAHVAHGGEGALYVRVRRSKKS
jgi:DNA-nicking Smr family endonuclease